MTSLPAQDGGKVILSGAELCGSLNVPCRTNLPGQALCSQRESQGWLGLALY